MWICYLIPICVHLIFFPFWLFAKGGTISLVEILIGTLAIPIYLIIISHRRIGNMNFRGFVVTLFVMLIVTICGILIHYFNWGITTENLLKPDSDTVLIIKSEMVIASIIVVIGWTVAYMIK